MNALNDLDRGYQKLLEDVIINGKVKDTRAGRVRSLFGKQFRIDLKKGFPLLTTKKVFVKGVIHELLWFLQRSRNIHNSMNIEYLVRNGVHIWDDDAFRWFKEWVNKEIVGNVCEYFFVTASSNDDELGLPVSFTYWIENEKRKGDVDWLLNLNKDEFIDLVLQRVEIRIPIDLGNSKIYRFGDLGEIYGKQWRSFGNSGLDQINKIIETLKTNPNDRRMVCLAWNPDVLNNVALPPCHVMMQFYTRELTTYERWEIYNERLVKNSGNSKFKKNYDDATNAFTNREKKNKLLLELEKENIPVYGLSCMYTCRSQDLFLGTPFNISSYALLTHIISKLVNMEPDMLIASMGDCHIYEAHLDAVEEQLKRKGSENLPKLIIEGKQEKIDDFKFNDFKIIGYNPDSPIKAPLLVGL